MQQYGIDLCSAYNNQGSIKTDPDFIDWYIALTHVVCTSLQMYCVAKVMKNSFIV